MNIYSIYSPSGQFQRTIMASLEEDVIENIEPGEAYLVGDYQDGNHCVVDGEVLEMPSQPSPAHRFDYEQRIWFDPRTQDDLVAELNRYRSEAKARITQLRGQARLTYVTDIPGQEMLYVAKNEEAKAYLVDPDPQPYDYPLIMSEVGVTAPTGYEVAQIFTNLNAMWRYAAGQLDAACFQAEMGVDQAPDIATIDFIIGQLEAALVP